MSRKISPLQRFTIFFLMIFDLTACQSPSTRNPASDEASDEPKPIATSAAERLNFIKDAEVWFPENAQDIGKKNLRLGQPSEYAVDPMYAADDKYLTCTYKEPDLSDPPGGKTPKFGCTFDFNGESKSLKVKYDPLFHPLNGKNGKFNFEVYGEVLSTRILWALGFAADRSYPVRVKCLGCPLEPWTYIQGKLIEKEKNLETNTARQNQFDGRDRLIGFVRDDMGLPNNSQGIANRDLYFEKGKNNVIFHAAAIEDKYAGPEIKLKYETMYPEGWSWDELLSNYNTPDQLLHRQALSIVAAFLNHMDSKPDQQRLSCRSQEDIQPDGRCTAPVLLVQDPGSSFGYGFAPLEGYFRLDKGNLKAWLGLSIWKDRKTCTLKVNGAPNATLKEVSVTEAARAFTANLMRQLTMSQIEQLFLVSQIEKLRQRDSASPTAKEWAKAFMEKMNREVLNARCG